jgi:hypothetical protein
MCPVNNRRGIRYYLNLRHSGAKFSLSLSTISLIIGPRMARVNADNLNLKAHIIRVQLAETTDNSQRYIVITIWLNYAFSEDHRTREHH